MYKFIEASEVSPIWVEVQSAKLPLLFTEGMICFALAARASRGQAVGRLMQDKVCLGHPAGPTSTRSSAQSNLERTLRFQGPAMKRGPSEARYERREENHQLNDVANKQTTRNMVIDGLLRVVAEDVVVPQNIKCISACCNFARRLS